MRSMILAMVVVGCGGGDSEPTPERVLCTCYGAQGGIGVQSSCLTPDEQVSAASMAQIDCAEALGDEFDCDCRAYEACNGSDDEEVDCLDHDDYITR